MIVADGRPKSDGKFFFTYNMMVLKPVARKVRIARNELESNSTEEPILHCC
jgi:hypothetical protein